MLAVRNRAGTHKEFFRKNKGTCPYKFADRD